MQVLTIHRSTGLEFPIVYCPFLWDTIWRDDKPAKYVTMGRLGMWSAGLHAFENMDALLTPLGAQFLFSYISAWELPELSNEYRERVGLA